MRIFVLCSKINITIPWQYEPGEIFHDHWNSIKISNLKQLKRLRSTVLCPCGNKNPELWNLNARASNSSCALGCVSSQQQGCAAPMTSCKSHKTLRIVSALRPCQRRHIMERSWRDWQCLCKGLTTWSEFRIKGLWRVKISDRFKRKYTDYDRRFASWKHGKHTSFLRWDGGATELNWLEAPTLWDDLSGSSNLWQIAKDGEKRWKKREKMWLGIGTEKSKQAVNSVHCPSYLLIMALWSNMADLVI